MITSPLEALIPAALVGLPCALFMNLRYRRRGVARRRSIMLAVLDGLLAVSVAAILLATLSPWRIEIPPGYVHVNLVPLLDLTAHASMYFVAGNVLMFAPVGFLAALRFPTRSVREILLWGVVLSAAVEITQLFIVTRGTNIDDLLMNGLGTLLGAWTGSLAHSYIIKGFSRGPSEPGSP